MLVTAPPATPAAGALPWRRRKGALQVALVHRPRYDDWSWAKGKLDAGEEWPAAAVREVAEETSLRVHLRRPLPTSTYPIGSLSGLATKEVRYWVAEVVGDTGALKHEIDEVAWLAPEEAALRLDYARDQEQLRALVQADEADELTTWPLAVVRHAKAYPRGSWEGADPLRPLDARGKERAAALGPILAAYGVKRLVSSPSTRCVDTLRPVRRARPDHHAAPRPGSPRRASPRTPRRRPTTSIGCCCGARRRRSAGTARCCPRCSTPSAAGPTRRRPNGCTRRPTWAWPRARCWSPTCAGRASRPGSSRWSGSRRGD